jgi:hypothetical protein
MCNTLLMQRRGLLKLGVGSAMFLLIAGAGLSLWHPGVSGDRLSRSGREVFRAVGLAVLDGSLPREVRARERALHAHLQRLDAVVAALSPTACTELSRLLALLWSVPGRLALANLFDDWSHAEVAQVQAALQSMRTSKLTLPQQAYSALRDLTMAAYFSASSSWEMIGYPGPPDI